jgi:hypothetical protein
LSAQPTLFVGFELAWRCAAYPVASNQAYAEGFSIDVPQSCSRLITSNSPSAVEAEIDSECENVDVAGLTVGAMVSLTRLKASKDLNGRVGKLTGFNYETGCWQDKFHKGRFKNVKPANLYWSSLYCCEP